MNSNYVFCDTENQKNNQKIISVPMYNIGNLHESIIFCIHIMYTVCVYLHSIIIYITTVIASAVYNIIQVPWYKTLMNFFLQRSSFLQSSFMQCDIIVLARVRGRQGSWRVEVNEPIHLQISLSILKFAWNGQLQHTYTYI